MSAQDSPAGAGAEQPPDWRLIELLRESETPQPPVGFAEGLRSAFLAGFPTLGARVSADDRNPFPQDNSRSRASIQSRSDRGGGPTAEPDRASAPGSAPSASGSPLDSAHTNDPGDDPVPDDPVPGGGPHKGEGAGPHRGDGRLIRDLAGQPLSDHAPRTSFREDLRRCFLSGEFPMASKASGARAENSGVEIPRAGLRQENPAYGSRPGSDSGADEVAGRRRSSFRLLRGVLVAAAAVLLLAVLLPREARWSVRLLEGDGLLAVSGFDELVPIESFRGNVDALIRSGRLGTGANRVQFTLGDQLIVEFAPQTTVDTIGLARRTSRNAVALWSGASQDGPWSLRLERGEAYIRKNKKTAERAFLIDTPDLEVEVLGTTLGVLCNDQLTCVCVSEGQVDVRPAVGRRTPESLVRGGYSLQVLRHEKDPHGTMGFPATSCPSDDPHDHHVCGLLDFDQRAQLEP